jgi:PhnB protein
MAVKPIPDGYHSVTPFLVVQGGAKALEFYQKAFGAKVLMRMEEPGGKVAHAEMQIGDSRIMLADEYPEMGFVGPQANQGSSVSLMLYVEDVDKVAARAVAAGARELRPVQDQFYGDRNGTFADPFGHVWTISTHKEDLSDEEVRQRAASMAHG